MNVRPQVVENTGRITQLLWDGVESEQTFTFKEGRNE